MYDYLAKIILLGPSGCGKSCLLHRFVRGECMLVLLNETLLKTAPVVGRFDFN